MKSENGRETKCYTDILGLVVELLGYMRVTMLIIYMQVARVIEQRSYIKHNRKKSTCKEEIDFSHVPLL